jgi:hypothetical protein
MTPQAIATRLWRANLEAKLAYGRLRHIEHRDEFNKKSKAYRWANLELSMLKAAKRRAIQRNMEFNIELQDIVIPKVCPVLGIPIIIGSNSFNANSPSIDRINNTRGYTKDNIMVISFRANNLKSDATFDELRKLVNFYEQYDSDSTC